MGGAGCDHQPVPAPASVLVEAPTTPPGVVAVHTVDLTAGDEAVARAEPLLTADELARARRGTPEVYRRRVLLRAALRSALGTELGLPPRAAPLWTSPAGRPCPGVPGLDANCSAAGALGLVVVGRGRRVGVDVEQVAPWSPDVLDEGWLSPDERRALTGLPLAGRAEAVTRAWTRKEAVLKARGTGLLDDPSTVVTRMGRPQGLLSGWAVDDLPVPPGWVASLAVGPSEEISA